MGNSCSGTSVQCAPPSRVITERACECGRLYARRLRHNGNTAFRRRKRDVSNGKGGLIAIVEILNLPPVCRSRVGIGAGGQKE